MARDDPVNNLPLCCQKLLFFLTLLRPKPSLPSKANPNRPPASPWPTEEQVRVRIVASQTLNCCIARLVAWIQTSN